MKRRHLFQTAALNIVGVALISGPAWAQTSAAPAAAGVVNEITVTARKRDERLIDVPISVQAFSSPEIRISGIDDLQTLKDRAGFQLPPQVSNGPAGRFAGNLIFRGLQANSFGEPRDSSGALFVDGIFVSGGPQSVNTVDVERIEVLKGPQNAYFGRSTFGGAVNFITRNPAKEFGGEANVRATARGTVDADASVEGPIVQDKLSGRVTVTTHNKVAQYHATDGGDLGAEKSQSIAGTLYFTPTANLWFRVRGVLQRDDDSAPAYAFISANANAAGACTGKTIPGFNGRTGAGGLQLARNYFCNGVPELDQVQAFTNPALSAGPTVLVGQGVITSNTSLPAFVRSALATKRVLTGGVQVPGRFFFGTPDLDHAGLRRNANRFSAQSGYTFDSGASLAFNAGYNQQDSLVFNDVDKSDVQAFATIVASRSKDLTLDARFVSDPKRRVRVLLGASYFKAKTLFGTGDVQYASNTVTQGQSSDERAHVPAAYGSIDFDILSNLTFTAEGRYQADKVTNYSAAGVKTEKTFKDFLPRAILSYKPNPNSNVYASYSKGVQPARLQTGFAGLANPPLAFPNEAIAYVRGVFPEIGLFSPLPTLDAYEIGIKQRLFGGRVEYAIAAYQNDWKNALVNSAIFNPTQCFATTPATANTAACPLLAGGTSNLLPNDARIRGVEFSGTARITTAWSVDVTVDYKDPVWRKYANTGFNVMTGLNSGVGDVYRADGNKLGRVPKWSATFSSTYRHELSNGWNGYVRADALYTGSAWDSDINVFKSDDYLRVNTRIGIEKDNVSLELYSTNLFNDKTYDVVANTVELAGNFTQRAAAVIPAQRREFGVRGHYKF